MWNCLKHLKAKKAEAFKDFDHSTGYNLPTRDPWVMGRAKWMMECAEKFKDKY